MKTPQSIKGHATAWGLTLLTLIGCGGAATVAPPAAAGPIEDAEPKAVQTLLDAARSEDALLRMNAVEAAKAMPDRALPMVGTALDDPHPAVRFAALVTAGRLEFESLGRLAQSMAVDPEQPEYVRAAALFAAHRCGQEVDLAPLANMLFSDDTRQRANAALLFGMTDDPAVIPVLEDAGKAPMDRARPLERELVRVQIAEALLNLGVQSSLKSLRGAAYSNEDEVRVLAVLMLGKAGDRSMTGNLIGFLAKDPVELRLAAAESLARLGNAEGLPVMLEGAVFADPRVRAQAAFALGQATQDERAASALTALLDDAEPMVRIAAAAAVLEHVNR